MVMLMVCENFLYGVYVGIVFWHWNYTYTKLDCLI